MLRVSLWSVLALIMLIVVAWSVLVLFLQIASVSVTRAETQLRAAFNPVHLGCQGDSVSLPKPGIPFEPDRSQRIGGRDLAEWLRLHQNPKSDASDFRAVHAFMNGETGANLGVVPITSGGTETTFPLAGQESGPVIVLFLIPPKGADSLSVQWGTNPRQAVSGTSKPAGIPAFKVSVTGE